MLIIQKLFTGKSARRGDGRGSTKASCREAFETLELTCTCVLPLTQQKIADGIRTQVFSFYGQINGRLGRVTRNDIQHSMVVVEDTRSRKVVGFLEIGMLPKPTSSEESALAGKSLPAATAAAAVAAAGEENIDESGPVRKEEDTRPEDVEGESDGNESDEEWAGSTAFERSPDVVYLANVVVDRDQRRRGIGRTIVKASLEIVKTLWPAEKRVYVSVEQARY